MSAPLHYLYSHPLQIREPLGNNFFSHEKRTEKTINIPAMIEGNLHAISESQQYSFVEFDDQEIERKCKGIRNFIRNENTFLFDNHNHSYYFFRIFLEENNIDTINFVHVDQHKDMRKPEINFNQYVQNLKPEIEFEKLGFSKEEYQKLKKKTSFEKISKWFLYTQNMLNVGNFIVPLQEEGLIKKLVIIDSEYSMDSLRLDNLGDYVLDLDLDFFQRICPISMKKRN